MLVAVESLFLSLPEITRVIVIIITGLTLLMVGPLYNNRSLNYGPTVLTMLGIFGCFFGISLGLMHFNTGDIQGSVPELLNGIKTAFWASVTGVGGALLIKTRHLIFGPPRIKSNGTISEATIDDLATLLRNLHASMAGGDDSSLISQSKLLRQENRDGLAALKTSLDGYMEKIAESNSKALIEALKEVIRDFNTKINEQFGENFRHLNAAVEKILVWQEAYRQQLTEMIEQQKTTASNMATATASYRELVVSSEQFNATANSLASLISTLDLQREQITRSIATLGDLLKTAGDNLPKIEAQIVEMVRQVETGVANSNEKIGEAITSMTQNLQTAQAEMKRLVIEASERANSEFEDRIKQLGESMSSTVSAISESVQASHTDMKKLLIEAADSSNKDVNNHIRQLSENTQKQVVTLDKALTEELSKSIQTLGEHLTALSRKFVDDYTPLTERLRALVQTAAHIQ
jgi:DNA anti-recombination protein RmuC